MAGNMDKETIEALLARVPEGHTPGPWYPVFNGHFWDISLEDAPMAPSVADTCASNTMYGEHMGPDGQPGELLRDAHGQRQPRHRRPQPDDRRSCRSRGDRGGGRQQQFWERLTPPSAILSPGNGG